MKKIAWYGGAAVASLAVAVALLLGTTPRTAQAATLTVTAIDYLKGSSVPTTTVFATVAAVGTNQAIPNSGKIVITFPAGTTFGSAATTAASWTIDDTAADAAEAPATAAVSGTTLTLTLDASSTVAATEGFTVATAAAGLIKFGTTGGTLSVATQDASSGALDSGSATLTLTGVTVTGSPTSIAADGVSTSTITIAPVQASNAGADTVSVVTSTGVFTGGAVGGAGTLSTAFVTAPTAGAPLTTVTATTASGAIATTATTLTFRAGSAAGAVSFTVYITPAAGGQAQIAGAGSVTLTAPTAVAPGLPASGTISPTTAMTVTSTGTTANITATFVDSNNAAPISGGTLSVNTTLGVLTAGTGVTTCTNQSCSGTLASGGAATVTLTGGGVSGTATVTFTTNGVSVTKTVTITGAISSVTAKMQTLPNNTATVYLDSATPNATTYAYNTNTGVALLVSPLDASNNVIPGVAPTVTFTPSACGASQGTVTTSPISATAPQARVIVVLSAPTAGTVCTATVTATVGAVSKTATVTFTIGGTFSSTNTASVDAADAAVASAQTVKVTVKDSAGHLVADGTSVTLVASAGALVSTTATTANGVATFTYVAPGTAQQVGLTAVLTSGNTNITASKTISVGAAAAPTTGGAIGTVPAAGKSGLSTASGSFDAIVAAAKTAGCTADAIWVNHPAGGFLTYVVGATIGAVNAAATAAYPTGLAAHSPIIISCK